MVTAWALTELLWALEVKPCHPYRFPWRLTLVLLISHWLTTPGDLRLCASLWWRRDAPSFVSQSIKDVWCMSYWNKLTQNWNSEAYSDSSPQTIFWSAIHWLHAKAMIILLFFYWLCKILAYTFQRGTCKDNISKFSNFNSI